MRYSILLSSIKYIVNGEQIQRVEVSAGSAMLEGDFDMKNDL